MAQIIPYWYMDARCINLELAPLLVRVGVPVFSRMIEIYVVKLVELWIPKKCHSS